MFLSSPCVGCRPHPTTQPDIEMGVQPLSPSERQSRFYGVLQGLRAEQSILAKKFTCLPNYFRHHGPPVDFCERACRHGRSWVPGEDCEGH